MTRFETLSEVRDLFAQGGVAESDYPAIRTAVVHHCLPRELVRSHAHWRLTSLLKDADGLDRVRLGDLDPRYLRNREAHDMVTFAEPRTGIVDAVMIRIIRPNLIRSKSVSFSSRLELRVRRQQKSLV